jgi:hypothetical protein
MANDTRPALAPREVTDDEVSFFKENGWVKLDELLPRDDAAVLLARLQEKMGPDAETVRQPGSDEVIKMRARQETAKAGRSATFNRWAPVAIDCASGEIADELFFEFAHAPAFNSMAERLMGFPVRYWVDESLVKMPGGDPTRWHRDSGSTDTSVFAPQHSQMMVWIALDRIPPEQASMRFVGLPHQDEAFQEVIKGRETDPESTYAELEELGKISPAFDLLPGDATVHGSFAYHSAPKNSTTSPRWAYLVSLLRQQATWTGNEHWPLSGVEGVEIGAGFPDHRFRPLG